MGDRATIDIDGLTGDEARGIAGQKHCGAAQIFRQHVALEWMKSRASFKPSLLDMCPPDLTTDLKTFGTRSWPDVKRLLAA